MPFDANLRDFLLSREWNKVAIGEFAGRRAKSSEGYLSVSSEYYRLYAARCVEVVRQVTDSNTKATLLGMAQAWLALADQAEKNENAPTLVYETPEQQPSPAEKG